MAALSNITNNIKDQKSSSHISSSAPMEDVEATGDTSQKELHSGASKAEASAKRKFVEWTDMPETEEFRSISIRFPTGIGFRGQIVKFSTLEANSLKYDGKKLRPFVSIDKKGNYVKGEFESFISYEFIDGKLFRPGYVRANYLMMEELKERSAFYKKEIADRKERMGTN